MKKVIFYIMGIVMILLIHYSIPDIGKPEELHVKASNIETTSYKVSSMVTEDQSDIITTEINKNFVITIVVILGLAHIGCIMIAKRNGLFYLWTSK